MFVDKTHFEIRNKRNWGVSLVARDNKSTTEREVSNIETDHQILVCPSFICLFLNIVILLFSTLFEN